MSRQQLNVVVRIILFIGLAISVLLSVLSAWPAHPGLGSYPGEINIAEPYAGNDNSVVIHSKVSKPSVVTFPESAQLPDMICMVIQFWRGDSAAQADFDEFNQMQWDQEPGDAINIHYEL